MFTSVMEIKPRLSNRNFSRSLMAKQMREELLALADKIGVMPEHWIKVELIRIINAYRTS